MSCYITITSADNTAVWRKLGSPQDYEEIKGLLGTTRKNFNIAEAILVPVRTNTWSNFAKDLFLPTTLHYAMRVENVALRILTVISAFIVDVATLLYRLITCIPRLIYNSQQEEHPLHRYLAEQGVDARILDSDCVSVRGVFVEAFTDPTGQEFNVRLNDFFKPVNLIEARCYEFSSEYSISAVSMDRCSVPNLTRQTERLGMQTNQEVMAHLGLRPRYRLTIEEF